MLSRPHAGGLGVSCHRAKIYLSSNGGPMQTPDFFNLGAAKNDRDRKIRGSSNKHAISLATEPRSIGCVTRD